MASLSVVQQVVDNISDHYEQVDSWPNQHPAAEADIADNRAAASVDAEVNVRGCAESIPIAEDDETKPGGNRDLSE
jgi:hypothetical protein